MEDAQLLERLTLLRALYLEARQQSKRAFPLSALSLLSLHDAVEGFLHLTALHLDIALPSGERFMAYWDTFAKRGIDIPQKGRMQQLNDDRVRFKHRGRLPHASEIPLLLDAAASLFEQVCEESDVVILDSLIGLHRIDEDRGLKALPGIENLGRVVADFKQIQVGGTLCLEDLRYTRPGPVVATKRISDGDDQSFHFV